MTHRRQILFVDDDPEDHLIMLEYFRDFGKADQIIFHKNGQEAIQYLEQLSDDDLLPNLIVLDLNMPILNGTQTLIQIKRNKRLKHIPVIIFSTSENENEKRKCLSIGALDYLVKPSSFAEGLKVIERFTSFIS
jgi:CheY-like chemotaxis protein